VNLGSMAVWWYLDKCRVARGEFRLILMQFKHDLKLLLQREGIGKGGEKYRERRRDAVFLPVYIKVGIF
jgi:hypothetical protein